MTEPLPILFTVGEVSAALGVSPEWLNDQCRNRRVPHIRLARQYRFTRAQVDDLVSAAQVERLRPDDAPVDLPPLRPLPPRRARRTDHRAYASYQRDEHGRLTNG